MERDFAWKLKKHHDTTCPKEPAMDEGRARQMAREFVGHLQAAKYGYRTLLRQYTAHKLEGEAGLLKLKGIMYKRIWAAMLKKDTGSKR